MDGVGAFKLVSLAFSLSIPDMTEVLSTWTLDHNSINQLSILAPTFNFLFPCTCN